MDKYIKLVKDGYEIAAEQYLKEKDDTQHLIPVFQRWLSLVIKNKKYSEPQMILELGCASGFPIGKAILDFIATKELEINYIGIDLSSNQVKLAHKLNPENNESFVEAEMLEYLSRLKDNSVNGVVSMILPVLTDSLIYRFRYSEPVLRCCHSPEGD